MSAADWASLSVPYAKLRALYVSATALNAAAPISEEARAGNRTTLNWASGLLHRLAPTGDLGVGVMTGSVAVSRWVSIAKEVSGGISNVMESCGEENVFSRFWDEVVIPTGSDVADVVKDAAGGFGFGLGAVAALVAIIVVLKVLR